ncbi:MAG: polX, partial [Ilumatobacteraceae bacterium]|nr:polX [Ilumatobacteraceae bacterium]
AKAIAAGCYFSIDSDAHATGQLEWQPLGCDRAAATGVDLDRVINTWEIDDLLAFSSR